MKKWIEENKVALSIFLVIVAISIGAFMVDWLDLPIMVGIIERLSAKLMLTKWISYVGFIIALLVPTLFYLVSENNRKKDKEENKRENERQFICNIITDYSELYWGKRLIYILYSGESEDVIKKNIYHSKMAYLDMLNTYSRREYILSQLQKEITSAEVIDENNIENYKNSLNYIISENRKENEMLMLLGELVTTHEGKVYIEQINKFTNKLYVDTIQLEYRCKIGDKLFWPSGEDIVDTRK